MTEPLLTVYCLTYNHEKYIRNTLEGFVNQKTDYPYQVIVHDDASTDGTAEIVAEYATKYPNLIIPILQKENQYSQGVMIFKEYIAPLVKGKYLAPCEGDDYWCDENKLDIQLSYMEAHPECPLCAHNTALIYADGTPVGSLINSSDADRDYTTAEIIEGWQGGIFHWSSLMIRRDVYEDRPAPFIVKGIGDFPLSVYASLHGDVHYIGRVMSHYRIMTPGGWTERTHKELDAQRRFVEKITVALDGMNAYTDGRFERSFTYLKKSYLFGIMSKKEKFFAACKDATYRRFFFDRLKRRLHKNV